MYWLACRFLRHVPVVYVDYPGETSLKQIYGTFNRAMLRMIPNLRAYADPLTNAMVEFYLLSQVRELEAVLQIHDILVRIRIRESMPLINGSGSWIRIL
jgi:hypothetical protein